MTFLPIVQRELLVAAQRKSTRRVRFWAVMIAAMVTFFSLLFLGLGGGRPSLGEPLFTKLTVYAFGLCLLAGVFLTADCLSEEKREGTLGFLFLTNLHGYDVVLGKFAATFVTAFCGLLALLPITALPLLVGGVAAGEFWRMALALMNALFVSLASGMWVSALARDGSRAMALTLGLLLILIVLLPVLDFSLSSLRSLRLFAFATWVSPLHPFLHSRSRLFASDPAKFWGTLACSQLFGWALLGLASRRLPSAWQERDGGRAGDFLQRAFRPRATTPEVRAKAREEMLPINPIFWLASGETGFRKLAWFVVMAWAVVLIAMSTGTGSKPPSLFFGWYGSGPAGFLLKALFAVQACRFFAEARRNGALEMLLCTPLTNRDFVRGQALALKRNFLSPGLTFVGLLFLPVVVDFVCGFVTHDLQRFLAGAAGIAVGAIIAVRTVADFFAVFWAGLALSLTMKKPKFAPALTILIVLILPSLLCWLDIFADLFFILWSATKLHQDFRWLLARQYPRGGVLGLRPAPTRTVNRAPPVIRTWMKKS